MIIEDPKENAKFLYNRFSLGGWGKENAIKHCEGIIDIIKYHGTYIGIHSLKLWKDTLLELEKL